MIALLAEDVALRDGIFAATREAEGESTEEEQQRILNSQATGCRVKAEDHGTMRHKDRHKHVADDDSRGSTRPQTDKDEGCTDELSQEAAVSDEAGQA